MYDKTLFLEYNYVFHRLNNADSHPFYISDMGYKENSNTINLTGNGDSQNGITGSDTIELYF